MNVPNQLGPNRLINWRAWLPSRGNVLFTLLVAGCFVYALRAGAIPPVAITPTSTTNTLAYQGRLADPNGAPLTGSYDMTFRLYNVATGGTDLWAESWTGVQVNEGLFNVLLGSQSVISPGIMAENATLWLSITVGSDSEMLPRIQLGSAPFAVQAFRVEQADVVSNVESVQGDTERSVNATGYIDLLEIPVTVEEAATLRITFHSLIWKTVAPGRIALGVRIDGTTNTVPEGPSIVQEGESPSSNWIAQSALLANTYFHEVPSGQHTVTLVLGSWEGGFAHARAYALNVEILKQP